MTKKLFVRIEEPCSCCQGSGAHELEKGLMITCPQCHGWGRQPTSITIEKLKELLIAS